MGLVSTTILLVAGGAFLGVLLTPLHWNALGDGAFGGVGDMTSAFYAKRVAEAMVYELEGMRREPRANWTVIANFSRLSVEARRVAGSDSEAMASSRVVATRARGTLRRADAAAVLEFLASEAGIRLALDSDWFSESAGADTVEDFGEWTSRASRLKVVDAYTRFPEPLADREVVALVGHDPEAGRLVVKSVKHKMRRPSKKRPRALFTFHAKVAQDGDDAAVDVVRRVDYGGRLPDAAANYANCRVALPRIFTALSGRFADTRAPTPKKRAFTPEEDAARAARNAEVAALEAEEAKRDRKRRYDAITDANRGTLEGRAKLADDSYEAADAARGAAAKPRPADLADLQGMNRASLEERPRVDDGEDLAAAYGPVGGDRRLRRWVRGRL